MKNIRMFLSETFHLFLVVKVSVYLNRHIFVMRSLATLFVHSITFEPSVLDFWNSS